MGFEYLATAPLSTKRDVEKKEKEKKKNQKANRSQLDFESVQWDQHFLELLTYLDGTKERQS